MSEKVKQTLQNCLGLVLGVALVVGLISWGMNSQKKHDEKYPWRGTFYMNGSVNDDNDELKTLEECRTWANDKAAKMDLSEGEWDYSCGTGYQYTDDAIKGGKQIKNYACSEVTK